MSDNRSEICRFNPSWGHVLGQDTASPEHVCECRRSIKNKNDKSQSVKTSSFRAYLIKSYNILCRTGVCELLNLITYLTLPVNEKLQTIWIFSPSLELQYVCLQCFKKNLEEYKLPNFRVFDLKARHCRWIGNIFKFKENPFDVDNGHKYEIKFSFI